MSYFKIACKWYFSHYAFDKGGFSLTVFTDKRHFLTALDGECRIVKYLM